ncbi:MAG: hypothetical protein ABIB71_06860 [Candidatus Woesearchaeota archaeon]
MTYHYNDNMNIGIINPYCMKIIVSARNKDSINAISKRASISFGWTYKWVKELAEAGVFKIEKAKLQLNRKSSFYNQTISYIKKAFRNNPSFYYSILELMGIEYCFTKTDAVFVWTKGGYQIGRSKDFYPIFVKIKNSDKELFNYYVEKLRLKVNAKQGIFFRPEYEEKVAKELCEGIPVDPLEDTVSFMKKYIYNFQPALEMIQEMYGKKLGVRYSEIKTNI